MNAKQSRRFQAFRRHLCEHLPADLPIKVWRVKFKGSSKENIGETRKRPKYYLIKISKSVDAQASFQILTHEWAHVLSWDKVLREDEQSDHGREWGRAVSIVEQEFLRWIELNPI